MAARRSVGGSRAGRRPAGRTAARGQSAQAARRRRAERAGRRRNNSRSARRTRRESGCTAETQQRGQRLISPSHRHSGSRQEKRQRGKHQADGQRKQPPRSARRAPGCLALRLGAHARRRPAGRPVTTGVMSSICALCASSTSPHRLRAQLAGEPQPQQKADRANRQNASAQKERFLHQRFTAHDHHPWRVCAQRMD